MSPDTQEIEHTVSVGLGGLFGCGPAMFTLAAALAISLLLNFYLIKSFFIMLKDASAAKTALKEVSDVQQAKSP